MMNARDQWLNKKDERRVDWMMNVRDKWLNKKKDKRMIEGWMEGIND